MKQYSHNEAVSFLNSLIWHDSVLDKFKIIRTGSVDQSVMNLNMVIDDDQQYQRFTLSFNDCYLISTKIHGGVDYGSEGEMIFEASAQSENPKIVDVINTWKDILEINDLLHFTMTLSSTNSEIEIVCRSISVVEGKGVL